MNKKAKLLILLFFLSTTSILAQNIQLLMSPKPSPYISDWQQQTETAKLVISNPAATEIQVKLSTELFNGKGALIANTVASKMPILTVPPGISTYNAEDIIPLSAVNYSGNYEKGAMQTGRIPDDNYKICVALTDPQTGKPVGSSGTVCKIFTIVAYQAPTLIAPGNKEIIKVEGIKGIVFRWTPVIPMPPMIVTYRLLVWEVLDGQTPMTALRSNQPIVEKDLKGILQTQWPPDFQMPELGKSYVWTITPLDEEGRKLVDGNGIAEPFEFKVWEVLDGGPMEISLTSPSNNAEISKDIAFTWSDKNTIPNDGYTLRIVEVINDQSDDPMVNNPAVFEQKGIMGKSFKYPDNAPKFKEGKRYEWAVKGLNGFSESFSFSVSRYEKMPKLGIVLISPKNEEEIKGKVIFSWKDTDSGLPKGGYTLKIAELKSNQSKDRWEDLMSNDALLFEQKEIMGTSFQYPNNAPKLEDGKSYVWQVMSVNGKSSVHSFKRFDTDLKDSLTFINDSCIPLSNGQFKHRICFSSYFKSNNCDLTFLQSGSGLKIYDPNNYSTPLSYSGLTPNLQQQNLGAVGTTVIYCFDVILASNVNQLDILLQGDNCPSPNPNQIIIVSASITFDLKNCKGDSCCPGKWGNFYYGTTSPPTTPLFCGKSYEVKCKKPYYISSSYICKNQICTGNVAYTMPATSGASITNAGVFTATASGTYTITISGICGKDTCKKCVFYFVVKDCNCDPCKDLKLAVQSDNIINSSASQINLTGTFDGLNNNTIKKVTAEIISFDIQKINDSICSGCVFDSKNYGNFILPASAINGYTGPALNKADYSRLISWNSAITKTCGNAPNEGSINPTFNLPIAVPNSNATKCFNIKICIKFTYYDYCCKACEIIKCYEIIR